MSRQRLTVVLSQAQGKNPAKRALEESIAAALIMEPGLDVSIVPYLYDLDAEHTGRLFLESVPGDMVVLGWMYPRAAFWLLDRDGIKGHYGESQIKPPADDDEDEEDGEPEPPKGIGAVDVPDRWIYCLDLRDHTDHRPYVEEVRRIAAECRERREAKLKQWMQGQPNDGAAGPLSARGRARRSRLPHVRAGASCCEQPERRWYPVIDYSRCTNCMECLDFCLFGVYGVDKLDRIMVENQDNCKTRLSGVQPGLSRAGHHVPRLQDAGHRRRPGGQHQRAEDRPDEAVRRRRRPGHRRPGARPRTGRRRPGRRSA